MFIDSHCHIHDVEFFPDSREAVYRRAIDGGVGMLLVGTSETDSRAAVAFAAAHQDTWAVVGVHPHDAKNGWSDVGELLAEAPEKVVGIGEIGLDYFYDNSPRDVQIQALEEQLQWAQDYHLPVSFHVRGAFDDFWPVFDNFSGIRGVLHSFTDTNAQLGEGIRRGLYIGVNGISTFTKDPVQQAMFAEIPLENMLLETDAPFLTPVPYRGKVNEPVFVKEVAAHHARLRGVTTEEIGRTTAANTRELFAL